MSIATERQTMVSETVGGQEITFETCKLAKQADGSVLVRSGDTMVLATAQGRTEPREGADFFPLTVDVEERMYAAGKIPGGFFKREGRPTERAILTARMIDRPIRPLWPKGYKNETQVICTVLSADLITAHDILCINGASAALMISPLPFVGPVGAVRIGLIDGELVVNPTLPELEEQAELDLIVVGTLEGLTMVEAGANEVPEDKLLEALDLAYEEIKKLCEAQLDLRRQAGKAKWLDDSITEEIESDHGGAIRDRIKAEGLRAADAAIEEAQPGGDPADHVRGRRLTTHARLRPVHPRTDADHVAAHAGHGEGGAADRRPLARDRSSLHAPLQLPALLGRGDGLHARPEAARHRPRRARAAGARADDPGRGRLPLHDPARLRDARVERLIVDGLGLRLDARLAGRRRADHGARRRDRDGAGQGGRRLRDPDRHPGRRGPPGRYGP